MRVCKRNHGTGISMELDYFIKLDQDNVLTFKQARLKLAQESGFPSIHMQAYFLYLYGTENGRPFSLRKTGEKMDITKNSVERLLTRMRVKTRGRGGAKKECLEAVDGDNNYHLMFG